MIPKELLRALRRIEITTRRLATEQLSGNYISGFKGQGLAFSEVRKYQPGDDIRTIDWNVSARMDETFVKVFVEEREMTVMLVVDVSRSKNFGTRGSQKSGEFSMYWLGESQMDLPMRLCVFSYWKARANPEPQRMPPYAENMLTTGAPAMAAENICDCVIRNSVW